MMDKRAVNDVKKYEYKFAGFRFLMGFDQKEKIKLAEAAWNKLGRVGWQFCTQGDGALGFMREIRE